MSWRVGETTCILHIFGGNRPKKRVVRITDRAAAIPRKRAMAQTKVGIADVIAVITGIMEIRSAEIRSSTRGPADSAIADLAITVVVAV